MKTLFVLAATLSLAVLPSVASAASVDVDVHRNVIVLPDEDVLLDLPLEVVGEAIEVPVNSPYSLRVPWFCW